MRAIVAALAVVASLTVAAPVAADPAPVYCGANDVVDPNIGQVTVSPSKATIGKANKTLTLTVAASDDCAIKKVTAAFRPQGGATYAMTLLNFSRISGTPANGVWRQIVTIPDEAPGGVWKPMVDVEDTYYNTRRAFPSASIHVRHVTKTTLNNPRNKVYKTVTLVGRIRAYGDFGTWKIKIQSHKPGKKWKTVATVTTNRWGDFHKKIDIKGTTYFRAVHEQSNTTTGSKSKSYKVKKR